MKRYHIAIEGHPTETVLAENGSDAFLKADFGSCRRGMEYKVKVYVAMDGEPDYPVNDSEFFCRCGTQAGGCCAVPYDSRYVAQRIWLQCHWQ